MKSSFAHLVLYEASDLMELVSTVNEINIACCYPCSLRADYVGVSDLIGVSSYKEKSNKHL